MDEAFQLKDMNKERFKGREDGKEVALYTLSNANGIEIDILNLGAKIVAIRVPDRVGKNVDILLGHDRLQDYIESEEAYFGAICGRYANRIAKGKFAIDGEEYSLLINNGPNALHGGKKGFNSVVGEVEHGCLVGRCFVSDSKVVGDRAETIGHLHLEFAWIPLLSIFRYVGENQL